MFVIQSPEEEKEDEADELVKQDQMRMPTQKCTLQVKPESLSTAKPPTIGKKYLVKPNPLSNKKQEQVVIEVNDAVKNDQIEDSLSGKVEKKDFADLLNDLGHTETHTEDKRMSISELDCD